MYPQSSSHTAALTDSLFPPTCRKLLAFPNKTHKNTYVEELNGFQNQMLKGQKMPRVYKWPEEFKFYLCASGLETEWRGVVLETNKQKPLNYVSAQLKVTRCPSVHRKLELHFLLAFVVQLFLKVCC